MKTINVRVDLLKTRGISPLAKILLSYFAIIYYVAGDGFNFKIPLGAATLGTTEKRLQNALVSLISKHFISVYGSLEEESVSVFMNKKLLNGRYEGFLTEKPREPLGTCEDEILENMVRVARRQAGLSKHTYIDPGL